jgi:hypothetical protein
MPDNKTVYITDDGQSKSLNVFVMDKAGECAESVINICPLGPSLRQGKKRCWVLLGSLQAVSCLVQHAFMP